MTPFTIEQNNYLTQNIQAFYHTDFGGTQLPNNPNFLYKLKNDPHHNWTDYRLQEAQQEWAAFGQAEQNEIQKLIDENVSTVAKEKNINVVLKKAAVTSGGVDLTDDVINKVGKAPSTDTAKASDTQTK